jgi:hypothetical protein
MKKFSVALFGAALAIAALAVAPLSAVAQSPSPAASAAVSPSPDATPNVDPAVIARAKTWLKMLEAGKIDRSQLTAELNGELPDDKIAAIAKQIAPLGDPVVFEPLSAGAKNGQNYVVFSVAFGNSVKLNYLFVTDATGKIAALFLRPPASSP